MNPERRRGRHFRDLALVQGRRGLAPGMALLRRSAAVAPHALRVKHAGRIGRSQAPRRKPDTLAGETLRAAQAVADREAMAVTRDVLRHDRAMLRDEATFVRNLREESEGLHEDAVRTLEDAKRVRAAVDRLPMVQLREANEQLVLATVAAQEAHDAALREGMQLAYMAKHDALTGLPNRTFLSDRLAQALVLARRHRKKAAVMFIDLDHFKRINDTLGHEVGDQLLRTVAARLLACVRHSDTVSRQGGDEFVVLLSEIDSPEAAAAIAAKAIQAMAEPVEVGGNTLNVTLSIGISIFPDHGEDEESLMKCADVAMYQAKQSGRNRYCSFDPAMNAEAAERKAFEAALEQALERHEFVVHYQPDVSLASGTTVGAEALVRWWHPVHGLILPERFIGIAEESGLMVPIGEQVLHETFRQMRAWIDAGLDVGRLGVNISAGELRSKHFLKNVRSIAEEYGLDPQRLEFEFTENVLMRDTELSVSRLRALKAMGFNISIDHFGTGYSSLSYLRHFPVDTLKIDQSFVHDLETDGEEATIAGAIIALGKSLRYRVVANGVETQQQREVLQSRGCEEAQGYLFSRPVAADAFVRH